MNFLGFRNWFDSLSNCSHLVIAGPCSAESEEQVLDTARQISKIEQVKVFRAGVWKPRTSPNDFEGVGEIALKWLKKVKSETGLLTCVEVATSKHVEKCLENDVDIFWVGARTVANPFSVQSIADVLKGVDKPVLIKNPINPDLKLWVGAIERIYKAGINKIAAIHRGFYPFEDTRFRNIPKWEIPIELKTLFPNLQIITDPSHIAGKIELIKEVASQALCMNVDGLMIETHNNPKVALSDASQQLTPLQLDVLLKELKFRKEQIINKELLSDLQNWRFQIDSLDFQMLELLSKRMEIVEKMGKYKEERNMSVFQLERWKEIRATRIKAGEELGLDSDFVKKILQIIHNQSIIAQSKNK
ncbi:MAG: bifunctional 3-deoxy-7-phosphoheptulonate synthase/chorismate mutase type II [Bacteroidales bacterium]|nr:bifunctional 3-deoxy-7-phosphoheptulonate synthase/chorismate mutase type II [Bacteroidales bacterium]